MRQQKLLLTRAIMNIAWGAMAVSSTARLMIRHDEVSFYALLFVVVCWSVITMTVNALESLLTIVNDVKNDESD